MSPAISTWCPQVNLPDPLAHIRAHPCSQAPDSPQVGAGLTVGLSLLRGITRARQTMGAPPRAVPLGNRVLDHLPTLRSTHHCLALKEARFPTCPGEKGGVPSTASGLAFRVCHFCLISADLCERDLSACLLSCRRDSYPHHTESVRVK